MPEPIKLMNPPKNPAQDAAIRTRMERAFGLAPSRVQPRDGTSPASAQAYVTGSDVFFAPGRYAPAGQSSKGLMAHELAHVAEQRESAVTR